MGERPSDLGTRDRRLVILAIPPYTDDHQAFAAITAASATGDVSTVDELPMISPGERRMRSVTIPGPCDDQCLSSEARHARGFQYLITERMPMPRFIYRRADD
ncbi:hypothetical protein C8258_10995 [Nocardia sp. MDA0666]|nr:hypothetical protein C8258_10995 [Nocardia sp. MDA0666]